MPTLVPGKNPLHSFLGYSLGQHVVSMSARDPADGREMPANGNTHVSTYSLRGVRKITPADWRSYVLSCKPDIVFALSDIPFTNPPYSQKRLTKSIERSASWLANILSPPTHTSTYALSEGEYKPNILIHMAGAASVPARRAFASSLVEKLLGPEADAIKPLETLDQGVFGYTFDLVPIRLSLEAAEKQHQDPFYSPVESLPQTPPSAADANSNSNSTSTPSSEVNLDPVIPAHTDQLTPLLHASLEPLPVEKMRLVNTVQTPHEVLRLISTVGIDIFDAHWAQRAADIGVALDFTFPAPSSSSSSSISSTATKTRDNGKHDIGHNLYSDSYTHDFSSFSATPCECRACTPIAPSTRIYHGIDDPSYSNEEPAASSVREKPSFTRAYIHHLLHTHEMSAHSLLVMHNLGVLDTFFASIRRIIQRDMEAQIKGSEVEGGEWEEEVRRFEEYYDESLVVFEEARVMWRDVDLARGRGRLKREKKRQEEGTLGTAVEL